MTITQPQHLPSGSPGGAGGQFAPQAETRPEGQLAESATGSFLFPPVEYDGVSGYIDFWTKTPISDRVLSNFMTAYKARRAAWIEEEVEKWGLEKDADPEWSRWALNPKTTKAEMQASWREARSEEIQRLASLRPWRIPSTQVRGIAIAARMYLCCTSFLDEEQAAIESHEITYARGVAPKSVKATFDEWHLDEFADDAFVDQDVAVTKQLEELQRCVASLLDND
ncbi:hypothetical protein [Rathayibacter iranicus]|uniref:Uncharacterized protein n=2 Tax=Rathayibacter iranicus TaxID=59737 RepID=A0AAD1ACL6_9MICO|nr:hypothetical protein [Rathayibacter iranicus]AZZ54997.1 hypothetical protein C7V51_03170 [Rathayibacter iranicus]MWV32277.1 hypothetical protein [Rathayibacter iranicus NCPPB 2253 = VKM Ac-1602]PPI62381.1 hypothetical protein C5E08_03175 [Rathayibacter iranicus]PWJ61105.1 hypothetical protein B0H03_12043 [Rathayibacter iranicus NCPPB 2253 = VKM Ac-1602]